MAFTSLNHYLDAEWLRYAYECTRKDGAVGVDGQTGQEYAAALESNLQSLLDRLKSGRYRAPPVRRHYIDKFALALEPSKTKLVKFGRFAQREARVQGKRPETFSFLGFTHYGTCNRKGNYKVGRKTEKSRLRRTMASLRELMRFRLDHHAHLRRYTRRE